jgi:dTDP-4-dehydrorhamnose 3,5-epimerase
LKFQSTLIPDVILIEPTVFGDSRGFFFESYHEEKFQEAGIPLPFVQDNHSKSAKGVLRGLHGQSPNPQGKLISVIEGEIFDVAVDARTGSPTYGEHVSVTLSAENKQQLYVPPGLVHGFCVTSDVAQVQYKCTDLYHPEAEFSVAWNDPDLGIQWPVENPVLSEKDQRAPRLCDMQGRLLRYEG